LPTNQLAKNLNRLPIILIILLKLWPKRHIPSYFYFSPLSHF